MLKELRIKNFKCFQNELIIPIDRINLLTGLNGRGKSTAIQPLLCMKQSYEELRTGDRLFLNGNCVELGSYEDIKNINTPRNEPILFGLEFESGRNYFIAKYKFKEDEADDLTVQIDNINVEGKYEGEDFKINVINKMDLPF